MRLLLITIATALCSGSLAYADTAVSSLTELQQRQVAANCVTVQATLARVHANDALSRVHLGQEYETIATKLMAPMNGRIAVAKLDGVDAIKTTVDFNHGTDEFRRLYQTYEQTMASVLQQDCARHPAVFYTTLIHAQQQRSEVRQSVEKQAQLVKQYQKQLATIRKQALSVSQQVGR